MSYPLSGLPSTHPAATDASARLKKELDIIILNHQGDIETVGRAIQVAQKTLTKTMPGKESR